MCVRSSRRVVSGITAVALIFSLSFVEAGARAARQTAAPQEKPGSQKKKKESNVDRGEKPPAAPPQAPPRRVSLNLKYRIFKRAADGHPEETNPDSTFMQDDRIQIRLRPSRTGYVYIIQSEGEKDGELIFPHSGIGGQNLLASTREDYIVPAADCDKKYKDDQGVCWLPIRSSTGRVWITVYFSPSQTDLPFDIQSGGKVARQDILSLRNAATTAEGFGKYGRQVNAARNARAVSASIELNHEATSVADGGGGPKHSGSGNPGNSSGPGAPPGTGPAVTPAVPKPPPSALWGKLESEFDNLNANGLRVALLKVTETGRVAFAPADGIKLGETLNLDFYGNFDAYVYIVHVSPLGRTTVVYPDGRNTKKIKANFRSVASMKRFSLNVNEKGVHTLQIVASINRVNLFEEAIEKRNGQLNQTSAVSQQSRESGFDCASSLNLFQVPRRAIALANDPSNQAGALAVVLAAQPGATPDACRTWTVEQVKGDKLKGPEVAVFEIRFKQV